MSNRLSRVLVEGALKFVLHGPVDSLPVGAEFDTPSMRRWIEDSWARRPLLLRAILGQKAMPETFKVFDFCAGFGADAFLMAMNEFDVTSAEMHSEIFESTHAAWLRDQDVDWIQSKKPKLEFHRSEGGQLLKTLSREFDVIYVDPMFTKLKESAKSPVEMQVIQELTSSVVVPSLEDSLQTALKYAPKVVVKSPLKGPQVIERKPNHQLLGKTIRYDIYLP